MKQRNTTAVMLPTNNPNRGRWVTYKWRSLYPGPAAFNHTDELAYREAHNRLQNGYRHVAELKRGIRRRLGVKALA